MRFIGVCLLTDDVPALTRFYEAVLQAESEGDEVHAEVRGEGASVAIYSRAAAESAMGYSFDVYSGTGCAVLMFSVPDVDAEYYRLKALGVEFIVTPTTFPWGARAMHFRDPDGNIVDFVTPAAA